MMFVHLLILLFPAIEAIPTGRFDVVYPSMETFRSGIKRIRFRALDQDIELRLEPAGDVIADDFTLIKGKNGEIDHSVDIQSLKKKLYKDAKMGAALHIDEDGPLTINGIVNSKLRIKPDTSKKANRTGIIAHRVTEVMEDEQLFHDYITLPPGLTRTFNYTEPLSDDKCLKIEYVFISEYKFTEKFKAHTDEMMTYLANMMNKVKILFNSMDLGIDTVITAIRELTKEDQAEIAPYIQPTRYGLNYEDMIKKMNTFYCKSTKKTLERSGDIVVLITPRKLYSFDDNGRVNDKHQGIAYMNGACHPCGKYLIVKDESDENERADTVAHESAHALGCDHDGEGDDITGSKSCPESDGYIMGKRNEKNGKKFSPCCKKRVEKMIKGIPNHCIVETCKT